MTQQNIRRIDIFRHGQSEANAGLAVNDPFSVPLTPLGQTQAWAISQRFNALNPPQLIVTSSMLRTQQTAAPTLNRFPLAVREEWPMHEITYLEPTRHAGTTFDEREPAKKEYWQRLDPDYVDGPNAESFNQFIVRVDDMAERLRAVPHDYSVVFSHGFVMRALWQRLAHPHLSGAALMLAVKSKRITGDLPNAACLSLAVQDGQIHLVPHWSQLPKCA